MSAPALDPVFKKKLKEVSAELDCRWSFEMCRWVIWYNNPYNGKSYKIHEVKNPDYSYKIPDDREINMLKVADMSAKVDDVGYILSKQFQRQKEEKAKARAEQMEKAKWRAKERLSLWRGAFANAERGIFTEAQLGKKPIYSLPGIPLISKEKQTSKAILDKLGRPQLTGQVHDIKTERGAAPLILNPY